MSYIKKAIKAHWGKRCKGEQQGGCPVCEAWAEYDSLRGKPVMLVDLDDDSNTPYKPNKKSGG